MAISSSTIAQYFNKKSHLGLQSSTGTAASKAVTMNVSSGRITSEALTTATAAEDIITLTNNRIAAGDMILWSIGSGTNTQGALLQGGVKVTANTAVFTFGNAHASEALNGTVVIDFIVVKRNNTF